MNRFNVRKVAVLGAGVMGAQIAAHLVNVKVPVVLFDLPAKTGPKNGIVTKAVDNLKKLKPAPLGVADDAALIQQANYEEHSELLRECDLVIEAIAERMDWKLDLYQKIAPFLAPHAIVASNTSGLSITKLSEVLPEAIKPRFCGIHFFNPPRYMSLVELIPTPTTQPEILDQLETFVTSALGKGVVRAIDTPNFIANRVGIAGMLATMIEAEKFGLSYDVVDDLTGKKLGRASSGTFRTADVVGLDTMAHVIKTLQDNLSLETDPFYESFGTPAVLKKLLELGNLGQKTKAGFFKKVGRDVMRFELESEEYVPAGQKADEVYARMLKKPAAERLRLLRNAEGAPGQFLWAILRNSFHYAAVHLSTIADNARDVDQAMRWGFGMKQGPFELWQEAGWLEVAKMIQEDIDAGKALCKAPLPEWVFKGPVADAGGVHTAQGSWSASQNKFVPRRQLPVYERQIFPEALLGETSLPDWRTAGTTIAESKALRTWTLDSKVLIASIKNKMHAISPEVMEGLAEALELAEREYDGMVIWSGDAPFSVGADLEATMPAFAVGGPDAVESIEQELSLARVELTGLLNLPPGQEYTLVEPTGDLALAPINTPAERLEEIAISNNADLREQHYSVRIAAAEAVAAVGDAPLALPVLEQAITLGKPIPERLMALNALDALDERARPVLPAIKAIVDDENDYVIRAARYLVAVLEGSFRPSLPTGRPRAAGAPAG